MKSKITILMLFGLSCFSAFSQMGKCKGKYLGNITAYSVPSNYTSLWNQTTSENGSKWGSCDRGNGVYNFGNSDLAYNTAKNSGGAFKFHALIWGAQAPGYLKDASAATIETAIRNWFKAVEDHYKPMGGINFIDVLNEPVNTPINREIANLKAALTLGYQREAANAGDPNNAYGWAIWPFQLARKHFPNAVLLINEFNTEHNWNNCRAEYIKMSNAIKNAPNLTDGKKNIIDGIGLQAHGMNGDLNLSAANFKACIDEIWNKTGLPLHITELDVVASPNETAQKTKLQEFFTIAWEHPHVAGITLWGYVQGSTWINGNGVKGSGGTDSGIQYADLTDRPAMTWLKQYMASQPSLACCPAPGPFANCANGLLPTVSITSPADATVFTTPATVTITANAADGDGTITKVEFYNGATKLGEDASSPYSYSWENVAAGSYSITAVATDNSANKTTSAPITVRVNVPQGPYKGTAWAIPGSIEFENYDLGGNGSAYLDNAATNSGGATFRTDEDVDIENCTDAGTGYNIGYATAGEWLEYTVNAAAAGEYDLTLRVACNAADRTLSLSSNGTVIANNIAIPNTAGWQAWVDVKTKVTLPAGQQVLRLTIGALDYVNLNYMTFTQTTFSPSVKITNPASQSSYTANQTVTIAATAASTKSTIASVVFKDGFTILSSDNSSPYEYSWSGMSVGTHKIIAEATDAEGLKGNDTITVIIKPAPLVLKLKPGWNLVGCPIAGSTDLEVALASIWSQVLAVKNYESFYVSGNALNSLSQLEWGQGYLVKVKDACELDWK